MGKRVVQAIEAICDRCGAVGDTAYDGRYRCQDWGELYLECRGERDGLRRTKKDLTQSLWLCVKCTDAFMEFMGNKA